MREITIVISDLYLDESQKERSSGPGLASTLPGLGHITRFGRQTLIDNGWRSWLARRLGRDDLAVLAPARVAAVMPSPGPSIWIATPVHLIASMTRVHLDHRGILRLLPEELQRLASDFRKVFGESKYSIKTMSSGEFLIQAHESYEATTTEPARAVIDDLEAFLPRGRDSMALRRLGAEIEMWLHGHPVNEARAGHGAPTVSTLWFWGGEGASTEAKSYGESSSAQADTAFGSDAYLRGLWHLQGSQAQPLPDRLGSLSTDPATARSVWVIEMAPLLQGNPQWTVFEALAELDRRYVLPALQALRLGELERVVLIANDRKISVSRSDRMKFWRRAQTGLDGLRAR